VLADGLRAFRLNGGGWRVRESELLKFIQSQEEAA